MGLMRNAWSSLGNIAGWTGKPNVAKYPGLQFGFLNSEHEPDLGEIINYIKTSAKFRFVIMTNLSNSVGAGFHNTVERQSERGRSALAEVDNFCRHQKIDQMNQKIARDVWACGNAFLAPITTEKKIMDGVYMLPTSAFKGIERDELGNAVSYYYQWGQSAYLTLPANEVIHFKWFPIDEGALGEGIGQLLARSGQAYRNNKGEPIYRPPQFQIDDMMSDVNAKLFYAGVPRQLVTFDDDRVDKQTVEALGDVLNDSDPLENVVASGKVSHSILSLDTHTRFAPLIDAHNEEFTIACMSPLFSLFTSRQFSYASAETAVKAMQPMIEIYQRAHKRFIESTMYDPIVYDMGLNPDKIQINLNWGAPEKPTIEKIKELVGVLESPIMAGTFDPNSIIDMLNVAGYDVTPSKEAQVRDNTRTLLDIFSGTDHTTKVPLEPIVHQAIRDPVSLIAESEREKLKYLKQIVESRSRR